MASQRAALERFVPEGARIAVSLPYYAPLKEFFRHSNDYSTLLLSEEERFSYGTIEAFFDVNDIEALIVHPDAFSGRGTLQPVFEWRRTATSQSFHAFALYLNID